MKTIKQFSFIALIFLLCMPSKSFAQYFNLYVLDPQARWYTGNATIDEASLTIKPAGIYFEYGLHLTISAKGTQFEGSATLPLEIVMNFCLPERAIIHDSWLWVNTGDTLTRKIWAGNFIYAREQEQQLNSTKREIIDTSLANRVLSLYTAFLALEPNDTISACETCEDDSDNTNTTSSADPVDVVASLSASPNPFETSVTISIGLTENLNDVTLKIYNMMGQEVNVFEIDASSNKNITLMWDGTDSNGNEVSRGVYIAVLEAANGKKILKLVKTGD